MPFQDPSVGTMQPQETAENCPNNALFSPIGTFWAKPLLAKPPAPKGPNLEQNNLEIFRLFT